MNSGEAAGSTANSNNVPIKLPDVQPEVYKFLELQSSRPRPKDDNMKRDSFKSERIVIRRRCATYDNKGLHWNHERNLRMAASTNNLESLEFWLKRGTNPNAQDEYNRTALHMAASRGYLEAVNLLIAHGADPNLCDTLGNNPLHLASCGGSGTNGINLIRALLSAGTDLQSLNRNGNNPIDLAKSKLKILLSRSHSISGNADESRAIIKDFDNVVQLMIEYSKMRNSNVDDLTNLSSRIAAMSTSEDVQCEISTLLDQIDSLKLA